MGYSTSELRANIYKILDRVILTGVPVEIKRKGKILKIVPEKPRPKLQNLKKHKTLLVDPEDIVHLDWSKEWKK